MTHSGNYCEFPFKWNGKIYKCCTKDGHALGCLWCANKLDADRNCKWGCGAHSHDWSVCWYQDDFLKKCVIDYKPCNGY